ncbi:4 TMS phage holin, superfamily IV [Propionibacterium cyclohexanicum]|mgnify:CR=1 FL=1|uniref:4 TMS phage holin, superfamily IV n=1 Tax=Propionibacterium cyclohexanicum TaxID=64702 RepID=A0A1H9RGP1_9ACTN|nr:phage holin family protein [Propionibacterium cyclohexanicum]SER71787.1 4 TMS phage holin, superfamily IV [Propionibacterium cyclohexanicum]
MMRFLLTVASHLVTSAVALLLAAWLIDGVSVALAGFLLAVGVFTASQAILSPFIFNLARKHAPAILGGIGLVSTLLSLFIATRFPGGMRISGLTAWAASVLLVWCVGALGSWLLGAFVIKRVLARREAAARSRA